MAPIHETHSTLKYRKNTIWRPIGSKELSWAHVPEAIANSSFGRKTVLRHIGSKIKATIAASAALYRIQHFVIAVGTARDVDDPEPTRSQQSLSQ